jgi:GTP cyclohydrolase I
MERSQMTVDDRGAKLLEALGQVLQQKGVVETPKGFVESMLNDIKTVDEALSEYQKKNGGELVSRQIQLSYGKGALEYLLMFL